jgi:hypothetical protein
MAPRSSNSKTAAIAGTLAGLLAAGLGAYYLYSERQPAQPAAPATTVAAVANAGGAPLQGAAGLQAPAAKGAVSREQAVAALMALPELKAWADRIETESKGQARGALMEYDAQLRTVKGKQYYQLSFVENSSDAAQRWESFLVAQSDGEILVDDDVSGEPMTLEQWRKEKKPLLRSGHGE